MLMEKFLFLDLDDTVFQTARKCESLEQALPASYNLSGDVSSYFLPKQHRLLQDLSKQWRIIPTTARTQASYARVNLGIKCFDGAILSHGATILCDAGKEDELWKTEIESSLQQLSPLLFQIKQKITKYVDTKNLEIQVYITTELNLDYYVEVRHRQANTIQLQGLLNNYIIPLLTEYKDFQVYLNDNSLTILPLCVNKSHAVAYKIKSLEQQYGEILTMGMGDSLSDLPFMGLCDYVMTPKSAQIYNHLFA